MVNALKQLILTSLFAVILLTTSHATDTAKEKRWANQVSEFLVSGESIWLKANGKRFLSIYTRSFPSALNKTKGAIIFLHGRGLHPDWPQVIHPLRTQLPDKGWTTLSLQMPILENDATDKDYIALFKYVPSRIQAGIEFLSKQGLQNIILIGHSLGSNMGSYFLSKFPDSRIKAFVGIGMVGNPQHKQYLPLDNVSSILRMHIPVLDVYGSDTFPSILESVDRLSFAIAVYRSSNKSRYSRKIRIDGANHFFQQYEQELLDVISDWISKFSTNNG